MSTNYYLVQDPEAVPCRSCGSNPTSIHIGLSSMGWAFTWQGYRKGDGVVDFEDLNLTSVAEWVVFLQERCAAGWHIVDEYRDRHELEAFLVRVEVKRGGRTHSEEYNTDTLGRRMDSCVDPTGDSIAFYAFT